MSKPTNTQAIEILKTCSAATYQGARTKMVEALETLGGPNGSAPINAIHSLERGLRYGEDMRSSQQLNVDDAIAALAQAAGILVQRTLLGGIILREPGFAAQEEMGRVVTGEEVATYRRSDKGRC